jgi:hypothetical protein
LKLKLFFILLIKSIFYLIHILKSFHNSGNVEENFSREYLVPSRATVNYNEEFDDEQNHKFDDDDFNMLDDQDELEEDDNLDNLSDYRYSSRNNRNSSIISFIEFYYDFSGFLPGEYNNVSAIYYFVFSIILSWMIC